ncbi:ATP-binding protein [Cellulomonas sp.]|uniref:ATP-binding protein n=1 Tax=Cellulomonas sp. TaxID=40001 RepID=UPI002810DB3F|nr:ATP-binding protein [Cellulomonas sp.]
MGDLTAAHRGYEYQDLMAACRMVDVVLGQTVTVLVDEKLFVGDRFDDLTAVDSGGGRQRTQFKHTDDSRPLALGTFTGDGRQLRLDRLIVAAVADRNGPGSAAASAEFRVVLRDARPEDERLRTVLRPADPDPGPFQPGMATYRMRFDAEALWNAAADGQRSPFQFLRDHGSPITKADLNWFCDRVVVEVESPPASWDLTAPGPAEQVLLDRLRAEVGAEAYPNEHRSAADVAEAFIRLARVARERSAAVTRDDVLRRAQLRRDYGAVARAHPVDPSVSVPRDTTVDAVVRAAEAASSDGGVLVLTAPPGHGKSWLCQQAVSSLADAGWLVAEHYCYLGDADGDLLARVLAESLFGSLLARVADADPSSVADQRPLLAATERALAGAVARALERDPNRPVALVVDGLDHVTRVRRHVRGPDPSTVIAEALAGLDLPPGSALIVLSQPGPHLQPLLDGSATAVDVPGLSRPEMKALATALHAAGDVASEYEGLIDALAERSAGNALYATYLCREVRRDPSRTVDPATAVRGLPHFDGTLENYYEHLWSGLDDKSWWVAEVIALVDFAVTRAELRDIRPDLAHRVGPALEALAPVLVERHTQGGVRIYHESFGRYLRRDLQANAGALAAVLGGVADWLRRLGVFDDPRAFRSLLPILEQAGRHQDAVALVDDNFVANAIAAAMPVSAIRSSLATAVTSAAEIGDWPAVVRCVELSRAAATLQDERYESTLVAFADVAAALLGADTLADRLLHEGRTVMAARAGLRMCAAVDQLGGVPPWREYLTAHVAEAGQDNTSYGDESDQAVELAWLRGRLRLSAAAGGPPPDPVLGPPVGPGPLDGDVAASMRWKDLAGHLDDGALNATSLVGAIADTYGTSAAEAFAVLPENPGPYCLALAEAAAAGRLPGSSCSARTWAWAAVAHGLPAGTAPRLAAAGLDPADGATAPAVYDRTALLELTRDVQERSVRWETGVLGAWLDQIALAATDDPLALNTAEALLDGPGWYRCWLRFCLALAQTSTRTGPELDAALLQSLELLTADLSPFTGDPRACDLYPIHGSIQDQVRRAVSRIGDERAWDLAIALVRKVGDAVSTTLFGELGGPLPADWVMRLTASTSPPSRLATVRNLAREELDERSGGRFYSDIADAALLAARVELEDGNYAQARDLWLRACRLLGAYGWRKDITVFELLDPFPFLIKADPARARQRLPAIQALCERVLMHTDGKETRHAPSHWWTLLSDADPVALAELVVPAVLVKCNDLDHRLQNALTQLWRSCATSADPFVSAALRLALDIPLDPNDPECFRRLAETAATPDTPSALLLAACLARLDERPVNYAYSNSCDLVAADTATVAAVNDSVRASSDAPQVHPMPTLAAPSQGDDPAGRPAATSRPDLKERVASLSHPQFPTGQVGLARAVRAWQARPYEDRSGWWTLNRAANVLGYRLLELAQNGQREQASGLLHQIADGVGFGRDGGLLSALAAGLSRHGEDALAATAGALAWTRARGHGGWLAFGGETQLEDLRAAVRTDPTTAMRTVAAEVAQAVRGGRGGTMGITQALVIAFASEAADPPGSDTAFACFDTALTVISGRAPRVHPSDDPDLPYEPAHPDSGERAPGDVDAALAAATVACLARPEREAKRRALLATALLVAERPAAAAEGVRTALSCLSDPATLTWLLALLDGAVEPGSAALGTSARALGGLAAGPRLTVRALARALCETPPPIPTPEPTDPELVRDASSGLWTPGGASLPADDGPSELVDDYAGERLATAEPMVPGLTAAVHRRVRGKLADERLGHRVRAQLDALMDRTASDPLWPDAYLAVAEAVEDALQRAAAGARSADLRRGMARDPERREAEIAERILDSPALPMALEAARRPRPAVPPPPSRYDAAWASLAGLKAASPPGTLQPGLDDRTTVFGTLGKRTVRSFDELEDADGGWRVLASAETLVSSPPYGDKGPDVLARLFRGAAAPTEAVGASAGPDLPPLAVGDLRQWALPAPAPVPLRPGIPLVGLTMAVGAGTDGVRGLGLPDLVVVPSTALLSGVGVTTAWGPFEIGDDDGPLLALRLWRTYYDRSDYHQARPRLTGAALVINERGFARLAATAPVLVLRDFADRRQRAG